MSVIEKWMIYGANGYTGRLIAKEAVRRGHQPVLAGRNEQVLQALATELDVSYRCFALESPEQCKQQLEDVGLVLNCAGPFSQTAEVMRGACLEAGAHYLDITGEIEVLESSYALADKAREKGVVIISGVGFDVVPTDVLAFKLKQALPEATHLELAFTGGAVSPGTAKTILQTTSQQGKIRRDGDIATVAMAYKDKEITFLDQPRHCMTIPWGDVVTAFYSTGIGNIEIYTSASAFEAKMTRLFSPVMGILKVGFVQRGLYALISKKVKGPSDQQRGSNKVQLWGRVAKGAEANAPAVTMTMQTPDGYRFTIQSALLFVEELLACQIMPGAYTPAQAVDLQKVLDLDDVALQAD